VPQDEKAALLERLKQFEGREVGAPFVARDAVNPAMIRHWCDAMDDANPVYTDPEAAARSVHGGIVAPPTMLQAWTMRGLKPPPKTGANAQDDLWKVFDAAGFTSIVAVNCDQEYARYLRPGDVLTHAVVIESISEEKQTALGEGHFITQRHTFRDESGEIVGTMLFRLFKFKPGTGKSAAKPAAEAKPAAGEKPSSDEKSSGGAKPRPLRPRPGFTEDTLHFWEGLKRHQLLIQRCTSCKRLRHPPEPMCPHCRSLEWDTVAASGRGTIYSFVVMHYPPIPAFDYPNPVGLIELEEGVRVVSNLIGVPRERLAIGLPVRLEFAEVDPDLTVHQFRVVTGE
jgi:uncharacterized OB-fold protein